MIIVGVALIIAGVYAGWISAAPTIDVTSIDIWSTTNPIIWGIGVGLVVLGIVLAVMGRTGHPVLGRRHYF